LYNSAISKVYFARTSFQLNLLTHFLQPEFFDRCKDTYNLRIFFAMTQRPANENDSRTKKDPKYRLIRLSRLLKTGRIGLSRIWTWGPVAKPDIRLAGSVGAPTSLSDLAHHFPPPAEIMAS
jgi:hypothetical protein